MTSDKGGRRVCSHARSHKIRLKREGLFSQIRTHVCVPPVVFHPLFHTRVSTSDSDTHHPQCSYSGPETRERGASPPEGEACAPDASPRTPNRAVLAKFGICPSPYIARHSTATAETQITHTEPEVSLVSALCRVQSALTDHAHAPGHRRQLTAVATLCRSSDQAL